MPLKIYYRVNKLTSFIKLLIFFLVCFVGVVFRPNDAHIELDWPKMILKKARMIAFIFLNIEVQ